MGESFYIIIENCLVTFWFYDVHGNIYVTSIP